MPTSITLPNNTINGRRTFDQAAVPINQNRGDIFRERNVATNDLVQEWFWNGTYWLGRLINLQMAFFNNPSNSADLKTTGSPFTKVLVESLTEFYYFSGIPDGTNYWSVQPIYGDGATNPALFPGVTPFTPQQENIIIIIPINVAFTNAFTPLDFRIRATKFGTPSGYSSRRSVMQ